MISARFSPRETFSVLGEVCLSSFITKFGTVTVFWARREAKIAAALTPESVVEAFQTSEFAVSDVQEIDRYPVPLSVGRYGIRFSVETPSGTISVSTVLYSDEQEANRVESSINDFSKFMDSQYVLHGFSRGPIVLSFVTNDKKISRQFEEIFRSIK